MRCFIICLLYQILLARSATRSEMCRTCSTCEEVRGRSTYKVLDGRSEGIGPLGRRSHRMEDNIKMDFNEIVCVCVCGLD
jgi:ATP-dependent protease Clp ATPase subunit